MSITIHIQLTGESGGEIANDLRHLLNSMTAYKGEPISTADAAIVLAQANDTPRVTAAQRKAAEKAAKEAAEAAAKEKAAQSISTGEERVDPAVAVQDAKDEAADTKAATPEPVKLTHDSVRAMLGGYVQAYGMSAAQEDGTKVIEVPKISDLKDDQAVLAKAVIAIANAIEKNPHKRDIAGDGITAEKLAELKPLVQAAVAVK